MNIEASRSIIEASRSIIAVETRFNTDLARLGDRLLLTTSRHLWKTFNSDWLLQRFASR